MSTTIGQYGNFGSSLILSAGIDAMTQEQQTISWETSTDTLSETYAGLGQARSAAISLAPQITQVAAWQTNVTNAQNSLSVQADALTQIVSLAQSLSTSLIGVTGTTTDSAVTATAGEATTALSELATVLNTSDGSGYVFAGKDSTEPPIEDTASVTSGTLATQIASIVSSLGSSDASTVIEQATTAAADNTAGTSVFSSQLSVSGDAATALQKSVVTGSNTSTEVGIVATQGTAASLTSTGSPIRDLMRDMMIVSGTSGMSSTTSGYSDLVSQVYSSLQTTISQLTDMESSVGTTQDNLTANATLLTSMNTALTGQLGDARDADLAAVAVQSSSLDTSLKASYMLVSDMKSLTLANYI
ncbi:putative flagellar hook-associated protein [Gluconacetobacter diazotrophicus PA1 5]|uniref:flagellin n=1 Tax=Gluconacetobacter diazotrophicus TaxID=33996 RepID=UPI000173CA52|nr:flagellin [Gluconacetobacter diazotrophicus]ACI53204.1 putative flagellar hook-associated protein [Gluconacetobacter diazotrophicus PA1 5]